MFVDRGAPHKHYPTLKAKAKETEYLCKPLALVWPRYCNNDLPTRRHMSRTLRLVLDLYAIAGTDTGLFHLPKDRELILETVTQLLVHYNWLAKWAEASHKKKGGTWF